MRDTQLGECRVAGSWTFCVPFIMKLSGQWKVSLGPGYRDQRSHDRVNLKTWRDYAEWRKGPFLIGHVQLLGQIFESVPGLPNAILDVLPKAEFEQLMKDTLKEDSAFASSPFPSLLSASNRHSLLGRDGSEGVRDALVQLLVRQLSADGSRNAELLARSLEVASKIDASASLDSMGFLAKLLCIMNESANEANIPLEPSPSDLFHERFRNISLYLNANNIKRDWRHWSALLKFSESLSRVAVVRDKLVDVIRHMAADDGLEIYLGSYSVLSLTEDWFGCIV